MRITQPLVRAPHVAYDNGDVLKPAIIAARVGGNGATLRPRELHKLDVVHVLIRSLFERQHLGIELERPVRIGDGYLDGSNTLNQWAWGLLRQGHAGQQQNSKNQDE